MTRSCYYLASATSGGLEGNSYPLTSSPLQKEFETHWQGIMCRSVNPTPVDTPRERALLLAVKESAFSLPPTECELYTYHQVNFHSKVCNFTYQLAVYNLHLNYKATVTRSF